MDKPGKDNAMITRYDRWKTSPPEDSPELSIEVECEHCEWEGTIEDAEVLRNTVLCPKCEEYIGELDYIIKSASEGWD